MEKGELDAGLKSLQQIVQEMKTLLSWQKLKIGEIRQRPVSGIIFSDTTSMDLMDKYSAFMSTSMQMHEMLNDNTLKISKSRQKCIKSKLMKIECQVRYLGSGVRVF